MISLIRAHRDRAAHHCNPSELSVQGRWIRMGAANETQLQKKIDTLVLTAPQWPAVFVALAMILSLVPFIVGFLLGLSVASDVVFGIYALISGIAADMILRWKPGRILLVWRRPRIPFVAFWVALCAYVILIQPFE